jgi:hypothetical protein
MDWYYGAASERKASITEYQPNMNNANQVDSVTDRSVDSGEVNEEDLDSEEEEQKASEKHLNQYAPRRVVPHHPAAVSKNFCVGAFENATQNVSRQYAAARPSPQPFVLDHCEREHLLFGNVVLVLDIGKTHKFLRVKDDRR